MSDPESTESLAQPNNEMFIRNIGHIAKRGREVEVWMDGVAEPRVGFLAGLDDEYLQVCITATQSLANIRRDVIISIEETGKTLGYYLTHPDALITRSSVTLSEDGVKRIQQKIGHFQRKAAYLYGGSDQDR